MATFEEICRRMQVLAREVSHVTGVEEPVVSNIIHYSKKLTRKETPDQIEENVFFAQLGIRFGISSRFLLQRIYDHVRRHKEHFIRVEDYVRLICIFGSPNIDVKTNYVFACYDMNNDGFVDSREIVALLKAGQDSLVGVMDDIEPAEATADLNSFVLSVVDTNGDGLITLEEFRNFVKNNILCIELMGRVLPDEKCIKSFMDLMKSRSAEFIQGYFLNERSTCLSDPPCLNKKSLSVTLFKNVRLELP